MLEVIDPDRPRSRIEVAGKLLRATSVTSCVILAIILLNISGELITLLVRPFASKIPHKIPHVSPDSAA